jgi:pimeloyl-ACP methyl ester carboxylesterase
MHSVRFTAETSSNGVLERDFIVGEVPGVLWSPVSGSDQAPLVLMGHGGGLHKKTPALMARAHDTATRWGFTVVAIDAPGHGDRPRTAEDEQARADLKQAMAAGETERVESITVRYGTALAQRAVPEWQATLDALQQLPEIGTEAPIGYGGGQTALVDRALLVSGDGDAQYWLLDPGDVSADGEWAAYVWASWYPGLGDRYDSFAALVDAERASFEDLSGRDGRPVHPDGADALVAEGRERALQGDVRAAHSAA